MNITKILTLSALGILLGAATIAAPVRAFDPGNCDSTITNNTIFPAPAAAFVNLKPGHTPASVAPVTVPANTPAQHVGPQQGVTPAEDVPAQEVPYGGASSPGVEGLPSEATPGFITSWTPDCITINNGDTLTWTNGDAEALHGIWFNTCFKGLALNVPGVDKDVITFKYNPAGSGSMKLTVASDRATDTSNPAGATGVTAVPHTCSMTGANAKVLDAHTVDLTYICILHGPAMTGHVHVKF